MLAAALWPALIALMSQRWSPGIAAPDELAVLASLVRNAQGAWPQWRFGGGSVTLTLQALFSRGLPHGTLWVQALPSLSLGLEGLLLARLGARLGGPRAGIAAALVNAVAAFSLLRARTLLAFSLLPLELLILLALLPRVRRPWAAFAWGLAAAGLLTDYEVWLCALPGLALLALQQRRQRAFIGAGFGLGLAIILGLSAPSLANYAQRRAALGTFHGGNAAWRALSAPWAYFTGAHGGVHELGAWPAFPLWALPTALLGLWLWGLPRAGLLVIAAIGLLPLAAGDVTVEARRASVAWPMLCLAAGTGVAAVLAQRPRWTPWLLAALLPLAGAEAWALHQGLAQRDAATYGLSRRALLAAETLDKAAPGPKELWLDLSGTDHDWERWWLGSTPGGEVWALVPGAYALPSLRAQCLAWIPVQVAGAAPVVWIKPGPALALRLRTVEDQGRALFEGDDHGRGQARLLERSMGGLAQVRDPWIRSMRLELALQAGMELGRPADEALAAVERGPLASSNALLLASAWLAPREPGRALRLARQATGLDPRRAPAWRLRARLAGALGLDPEARLCLAQAAQAEDW